MTVALAPSKTTAATAPIALGVGDPAPWFRLPSLAGPEFALDAAAGRYVVLCFYGSAGDSRSATALAETADLADLFDGRDAVFFGISNDPEDARLRRVQDSGGEVRHFWDFDGAVSRRYGVLRPRTGGGAEGLLRQWFVLDPMLRVIATVPFAADGGDKAAIKSFLRALPPMARYNADIQPPILFLANVFERALCERLIALFQRSESAESGFYADIGDETRALMDYGVKRRTDVMLREPALLAEVEARIGRRVVPEIAKIFQSTVPLIERPVLACYDGATGGHFLPHRDNTSRASAHRRFAVSINLNDDFDGGDLTFPEFGRRGYRPPAGGAVIFSCALLHAVVPVTRGRRYAFLPFLYSDKAARISADKR